MIQPTTSITKTASRTILTAAISSIAREATNDSSPQSLKSPRFLGEKRCSKLGGTLRGAQISRPVAARSRKNAKIGSLRDHTEQRIEFSHGLLDFCTLSAGLR
jgi:hypothetical protein